jgi:phosphinothricin acetyltransferase
LDRKIRTATHADAPGICAIYNHYIAESVATFEETPVAVAEMSRRIETILSAGTWLATERNGLVTGYAYATQWKPRSAYRYAVESTIYLAPGNTGGGTGTALYAALIGILQQRGIHCVVAGVALPNDPSVALHEKLGFTKVAHFRENGFKFGRWVDVGYWQRLL